MGVDINEKVVIVKAKGKKDYPVAIPSKTNANINDFSLIIPNKNKEYQIAVVPTNVNINDNVVVMNLRGHKDYLAAISDRKSEGELIDANYLIKCVERGHTVDEENPDKFLRLFMYKPDPLDLGTGVRVIKENWGSTLCSNIYSYQYPQYALILSEDQSLAYEGNGDPIDIKITGLDPDTTYIFSCFTKYNNRYSIDKTMACCRTPRVISIIEGFFVSNLSGFENLMGWYYTPYPTSHHRDYVLYVNVSDEYTIPSWRPYQEPDPNYFTDIIMYLADINGNYILDDEGEKIEAESPSGTTSWRPEEQTRLYNYYESDCFYDGNQWYDNLYTNLYVQSGFSSGSVFAWLHNDYYKDPLTTKTYSYAAVNPSEFDIYGGMKRWELTTLAMNTSWVTQPDTSIFQSGSIQLGYAEHIIGGSPVYTFSFGGKTKNEDSIVGNDTYFEINTTISSPFVNKYGGGSYRFPFKTFDYTIGNIYRDTLLGSTTFKTYYNGSQIDSGTLNNGSYPPSYTMAYHPNFLFKHGNRIADDEQSLDTSPINVYDFDFGTGIGLTNVQKNTSYYFLCGINDYGVKRWYRWQIYPTAENYSSADDSVTTSYNHRYFYKCVNDP